jgi:hypothetical protein
VQDWAHYPLVKSIFGDFVLLIETHNKTIEKSIPLMQIGWLMFGQATIK